MLVKMVFGEGGDFEMWSAAGKRDAKPAHRVTLNDFFIGKYEVAQELWTALIGYNPNEIAGCPHCPVNDMNWQQLQDFLDTLTKCAGRQFRLPTEAEWEYAAQGGEEQAISLQRQ